MRRGRQAAMCAATLWCAGAVSAPARSEILVDYETPGFVFPPGYVEDGVLTGIQNGTHAHVVATNDPTGYFANDTNPTTTISMVDGSTFGLLSLDLGNFALTDKYSFTVTGWLNGVQTGSFGGALETSFVTYSGTSLGLVDLVKVRTSNGCEISDCGILEMDNVRIEAAGPIPEPATWGLMLIGFGGIGFAVRRQRRLSHIAQRSRLAGDKPCVMG